MNQTSTPTDNPIIESLNGWIKEELYKDFKLYKSNNIYKAIDDYIAYFNNEWLACTLGYKNPIQYRTTSIQVSFNCMVFCFDIVRF
ncbi:MAG: IS3 family transposase [Bacilli bacterium]|nr:IS3 family transposase [Bacilli bacterium]